MLTLKKRRQHMNPHADRGSKAKCMYAFRRGSSAIGNEAVISLFFQCMINIHSNAPYAAAAAYGADL